mgnify:CR=1 FL=1
MKPRITKPNHWVFAGTGVKASRDFGSLQSIVGYVDKPVAADVRRLSLPSIHLNISHATSSATYEIELAQHKVRIVQ